MRGAQNVPLDDAAEQLAIQRRMKIADALRQQSSTELAPQMVGSQLVAPSPLQHIARALAGWQANRADTDTMNMASQYADAKRQRIAQALAGVDMSKPGGLYQAGLGILNDNPQLAGQLITGGIGNDRMENQFKHQDQTQERLFGQQNDLESKREAARQAERQAELEYRAKHDTEEAALRRELAGIAAGNANKPYSTPIYTPEGVFAFDNRAGVAKPVMGPDNKPLMRATDDPTLAAELAGAKAGAQVDAKAKAQAKLDLPTVEATTQQMIKHVSALKDHPGMSDVVGVPNVLTLGGLVPGTQGADFRARLDQVKGGTFLQAYNTLKGGGQITEKEGQAATAAKSRMSRAQSEEEFIKAAREYQKIVMTGVERARQKAGVTSNSILDEADAIVGQ